MTAGADQFEWVNAIQRDIAIEALAILRGAIREFDLGKAGRLRLSAYAHDTPRAIGIGSEEAWLRPRTEVAAMLVSRGVLHSSDSSYVGGPYVSDADRGYGLFVEADENTVRAAAAALEKRLNPKPPPRRYDPTWVADIDRQLLERLRPLMGEIKHRFDMDLEAKSVDVHRTGPTVGGLRLPPDQTRRMIENRKEELRILQQRGMIRGWEIRGSGPGFPDGFTVSADPRVVEATIASVEYVTQPHRVSRPPTQPQPTPQAPQVESAQSVPGPSEQSPVKDFSDEFRRGAAGELGKRTVAAIWSAIGLILLLVLGAVPKTRNGVMEFARNLAHTIAGRDSAESKH